MPDLIVTEAPEGPDREACYAIRNAVFCIEQGVGTEIEFDGLDADCRHYLARRGDTAVGTARVRPLDGDTAKIERVAVLGPWRGRDIGLALMERTLRDAAAAGHRDALIYAQTHAAPFYRKVGFTEEGEGFMEAGIPHIRMRCVLAAR